MTVIAANDQASLSVVMVNWNTAPLLPECLASVAAAIGERSMQVIVVDNGSTDGSVDFLRRNHPDVQVVANDVNAGYQAACNQGSALATGDVLLHINTDARLLPGALDRLLTSLADDPTIGVVAPRLQYDDGTFQRWTAGRLPSLRSLSASFLFGDRLAPDAGLWIRDDVTEPRDVEWVSSACLVVRRSVFEQVGGLDERFFAYMDDVDLCQGAAQAGYRVRYEPRADAVHLMGGSQAARAGGASPMAIDAMVRWFRLHRSAPEAVAAASIMALGFALRAGAHLAGDAVRGRGLASTRASLSAANHALRAMRSSS